MVSTPWHELNTDTLQGDTTEDPDERPHTHTHFTYDKDAKSTHQKKRLHHFNSSTWMQCSLPPTVGTGHAHGNTDICVREQPYA